MAWPPQPFSQLGFDPFNEIPLNVLYEVQNSKVLMIKVYMTVHIHLIKERRGYDFKLIYCCVYQFAIWVDNERWYGKLILAYISHMETLNQNIQMKDIKM